MRVRLVPVPLSMQLSLWYHFLGLRISELCGLTVADIDFKNEVVIIDHQLLKSKEQGYYIETPKTKSGIRQVPLSRETIQAFQRVMKKRPKTDPFVIYCKSFGFMFLLASLVQNVWRSVCGVICGKGLSLWCLLYFFTIRTNKAL